MLTTGVPRYEHSLMPADELPTRQLVAFSSAMNSSTGTLVMKRICSVVALVMLAEMPEALGHLAGAGVGIRPEPDRRHVERADRLHRRLEMPAIVRLGRDRMLNHHQERLRDVDRVADAVAVHALVGQHRRRPARRLRRRASRC